MLNEIFGNNFTVFKVFTDTAGNLIRLFLLHWTGAVRTKYCLSYNLFYTYWFLYVYLHSRHEGITSMVSFYVLPLCRFLFVFPCFIFYFKPNKTGVLEERFSYFWLSNWLHFIFPGEPIQYLYNFIFIHFGQCFSNCTDCRWNFSW